MKTANSITPSKLYHPGRALAEEVEYRGITQKALAEQMDISPTVINEIISGKRNITTATAIKIENALGINALFFLNMQVRYDYYTAKGALKKHVV